jgi:hypothetical protein
MIGQGRHYRDTSLKYHPQTDTQNNRDIRIVKMIAFTCFKEKKRQKVIVITEDYKIEKDKSIFQINT